MLKRPLENQEDLDKCPVCGFYFNKAEGFTCVRCRRGPLCHKHKVAGSKECVSCVAERRYKELSVLKEQEKSLQSFLRFLQFVFLVFSLHFIAMKIGLEDTVEFLQYSFIKTILPFIGGGSLLGYLVFYFILRNQKTKIIGLENIIKKIRLADQ